MQWGRVIVACVLGALIGLASITVLPAAPASAAQQQDANAYAYWNLSASGAIWNVDQNIQVRQTAGSTYWAGNWQWNNTTSSSGGYFGVQENGVRFDGTTGSTAIFSIWDANGTRGPSCGTFGGEGSGYSCRIAYPVQEDRMYRLRLWRQESDGVGVWWGAWIRDQTTGQEQSIGGIRAPLNVTSVSGYMNFTEYFGGSVASIDRVPRSVTDYTQPAANQQSPGLYEAVGSFSGSRVGRGTTGTVALTDLGWTNAARVTMGGVTEGAAVAAPPPSSPNPGLPTVTPVPPSPNPGLPTVTPAPRRCVVPHLIGRTLRRARTLAVRARCTLGRVKWAKRTRRATRARISSQRPKGGITLRVGATVSVTMRIG